MRTALNNSFQKALAAANAQKAMRVNQARRLVKNLRRSPRRAGKQPVVWAEVEGTAGKESVVFKGGPRGQHAIDAGLSDAKRILGHWQGYVTAAGYRHPKVGDRVGFYGPYSPALKSASHRSGKIVKVTPSRIQVEYVPLTSKTGKAYPMWLKVNDVWWLSQLGVRI